MSDDEAFWSSFLESRLPELGLDYETYGPYVIGVVGDDNDDEGEGGSLEDIMELLKASSESHGDDEEAWNCFQAEVEAKQIERSQELQQKSENARITQKQQEHERLQKEIELAQQQQELEPKKKKESSNTDAAKRALLAQYAYDESQVYDASGNLKDAADNKDNGQQQHHVSNKEVAAQARLHDSKEKRQNNYPGTGTGTKKEAQAQTKKSKEDKVKLKEDRRKRATKGERRS